MTPTNPVYHFLCASFQIAPDDFFSRYFKSENSYCGKGELNPFYEVIEKLTKTKVDKTTWKESNDEVIDAWGEHIKKNYWESISNHNVRTPFEFLKRAVEDFMVLEKDQPLFRIRHASNWYPITFQLGEDLFAATLLADRSVKHRNHPHHFQWKYILRSDYTALNELIQRKKPIDNHAHLGGTSPNVDLSWIYLMNNPFCKDTKAKVEQLLRDIALDQHAVTTDSFYTQKSVFTWIQVATYIRLRLFEDCCLEVNPNPWNGQYVLNKINDILEASTIIENDYVRSMINLYSLQSPSRNYLRDRDFNLENLSEIRSNRSIDYAIFFPERTDLKFYELSGERGLYYHCLKKIFSRSGKNAFDVEILFFLYLLIKNRFNALFIQKNKKYGFDNFQRYQDPKSAIIKDTPLSSIAKRMAIWYNIEENCMEQFESRLTPAKSAQMIKDTISFCDKHSGFPNKDYPNKDYPCHHYVIHFTKNKKPKWCAPEKASIPICRESALRQIIKEQALAIKQFRCSARKEAFRVFGIDAASHEVNCRPEIFGQAFRFLSDLKQEYPFVHHDESKTHLPELKKTYHAGEDFYDMVDGLRAIDEAAMFLQLKHGDRIGHGVALGLCPENYYKKRHTIAMPLQNLLDNCAWLLYKINDWRIEVPASFIQYLQNEFEKYFNRIYNHHYNSDEAIAPVLLTYIESWKFRGDDPYGFSDDTRCSNAEYVKKIKQNLNWATDWDYYRFRERQDYKEIRKNVYELVNRYHYDEELKREAQKIVTFKVRDEYIELVKQIQTHLKNVIIQRGIGIESCPSSNFLISNLEKTIELPTFKIFPIEENEELIRLNVSINTDDQGVFYTSLTKEYALLAAALQAERCSNGTRKYSDDAILHWIEKLIDNSKVQCFRKEK